MTTKTRSRSFKKPEDAQDFWPSFTDVMSTVAMLLFFLMLLAYIQNILTGKELSFMQSELERTRQRLAQMNSELDQSRQNLEETARHYEQTQSSLEDARWNLLQMEEDVAKMEEEISKKEEALKYLEDEIDKARAEVEKGQEQLTLSQQEVEAQQHIIAMSNRELGNLRAKLTDIAVMRVSILEKVSNSIADAIGRYTDAGEERVAIGPNANIVINETLLFDYASSVVKEDAKQLLDQLANAFERLLDDGETRRYIDYISIEGHTDSAGSAGYNRSLSAERAVSVVNYIMESNPNLEQKYAEYFGIGGFSKFRPLSGGDDDASRAKNRRIEISVVVKDENIRAMIEDYLRESAR